MDYLHIFSRLKRQPKSNEVVLDLRDPQPQRLRASLQASTATGEPGYLKGGVSNGEQPITDAKAAYLNAIKTMPMPIKTIQEAAAGT
ncbi:hypothetical protein WJX72_000505 [[Myrmecia] bisecta]|uniref:Uncharacterized protein n=1 Tax=[Myrmecia] bisecta TaxID=41462 RepID=A0AAW1Q6C7_9CHLO